VTQFRVVEGPLKGKEFRVEGEGTIGRGEECSVRLDGRHISRVHARVEKRGDQLFLRDNGSRNGVFVNGRRVDESVLRSNDEIEIGEHVLVFDPSAGGASPRLASAVAERLEDPFGGLRGEDRMPGLVGTLASLVCLEEEREVAQVLLDALTRACGPDRAFVMAAEEGGKLRAVARKVPSREEDFYLSNVLLHQILHDRVALIATDVWRRGPLEGKRIEVLCAPLGTAKVRPLGLAYLEKRLPEDREKPTFVSADLRVAAALAAVAGIRMDQLRRVPLPSRLGAVPYYRLIAAYEKECVVEGLRRTRGDLKATATLLGISGADLDRKLRELGLDASAGSEPSRAEWKSVEV